MNILLSSFCFNQHKFTAHSPSSSENFGYPYTCLPPVCRRSVGNAFTPDYSVFFLGNNFYVDSFTIELVDQYPAFYKHKELFSVLLKMGKLQIIDFKEIIEPYQSIINNSSSHDLANIEDWRKEVLELCKIWFEYCKNVGKQISDQERETYYLGRPNNDPAQIPTTIKDLRYFISNHMVPGLDWKVKENMKNWKRISKEYKSYTTDILSPYFIHIASNICLSECLDAAIHDWFDLAPLYKKKFGNTLQVNRFIESAKQQACGELIRIMFPNFIPKSEKALTKLLENPKLDGLRNEIQFCVNNRIPCDTVYAENLLRDIIGREEKIKNYKSLIGWLTMPLSSIPGFGNFVEKGVKKGLDNIVENKFRKERGWFYLLSEADVNAPMQQQLSQSE